jgi:hypothetical protein
MSFLIRVIDVPGPPGVPQISELTGEKCRVDWNPPLENGGCDIRNSFSKSYLKL